jgi:tRNA-splicing ligase RtcB
MAISELKGAVVTAKLWARVEEVESQALTQLRNIASLPWVAHVAVMPDVHFGKGATVGSVIAMRGAVSPAAVGVDIGCGMGAIKTNLKASDLPESLAKLRADIEATIPVGFHAHPDQVRLPKNDPRHAMALQRYIDDLFAHYESLDPHVQGIEKRARVQLGTLGGGNHFIELCVDKGGKSGKCPNPRCIDGMVEDCSPALDECHVCNGTGTAEPSVWMMLHSGSRNIGKELAEIHMSVAKDLGHNVNLPDRDLAVFLAGTEEMRRYRHDLMWAQHYAMLNRRVMFELYKTVLIKHFPNIQFEAPILCHHNYVSEEKHFNEDLFVTRKGAISAKAGELGIIPGSMGAKSFIVQGLGSADALTSASHGAGRKMSRGKAKKAFTVADLAAQTAGVECRKDDGVIDEIPGAYKDIEAVMKNQADLVSVVAELKQVLCVKG